MSKNPAGNVAEFLWQWERGRPPTRQSEVEEAMATWRPLETKSTAPYREAVAKALLALATWIAPSVKTSEVATASAGEPDSYG
jgi:hypothetical protein